MGNILITTTLIIDPDYPKFKKDLEFLADNPSTGIRGEYEGGGEIKKSSLNTALGKARRRVAPFERESLENILVASHWHTMPQLYTAAPIGKPYPSRTSSFQQSLAPLQRDLVRGVFMEDIRPSLASIKTDKKAGKINIVLEPNYLAVRDRLRSLGFKTNDNLPTETKFRKQVEETQNPGGISGEQILTAIEKSKAKSSKRRPPNSDMIARALVASHVATLPNAYTQNPQKIPYGQRVLAATSATAAMQSGYVKDIYDIAVIGEISALITRQGAKTLARQKFRI